MITKDDIDVYTKEKVTLMKLDEEKKEKNTDHELIKTNQAVGFVADTSKEAYNTFNAQNTIVKALIFIIVLLIIFVKYLEYQIKVEMAVSLDE
jgi:ABC-type lipoprotein release transport system permease subunit